MRDNIRKSAIPLAVSALGFIGAIVAAVSLYC